MDILRMLTPNTASAWTPVRDLEAGVLENNSGSEALREANRGAQPASWMLSEIFGTVLVLAVFFAAR